jgi:hypothetical protein
MNEFVTDGLSTFGPFGRYNEVVVVNNETRTFSSGNDLGAAAFIIGETAVGTVTLAKGGVINLAHLTVGVLYEIGISSITVNAKDVYVLKR